MALTIFRGGRLSLPHLPRAVIGSPTGTGHI